MPGDKQPGERVNPHVQTNRRAVISPGAVPIKAPSPAHPRTIPLVPQLELPLTVVDPPLSKTTRSVRRESEAIARVLPADQILKTRDVLRITGCHRCTLYRWMSQGRFPKKRKFKGHPIGWSRKEVEQWMGEHP